MAKINNNTCPICDSKDISKFIEILNVPIYCNLLFKTRAEALAVPKADMKLGFCKKCGHVYNYAFDPSLLDYTLDYENSLHFSTRFQKYAEGLATELVERYNLRNKDIIEIGCGDGDFLSLLCRIGDNRGLGFDPSHVPDLDKTGSKYNITFIRDYYAEKYAKHNADLICCRHVLEHIHEPQKFLKNLRKTIKSRENTIVFFEVPNVLFTLKDLGIWDLIYEHCGYFSMSSLAYLFRFSGFKHIKLMDAFEGQFLCIEAILLPDSSEIKANRWEGHEEIASDVAAFSRRYYDKLTEWQCNLENMKKDGRNAVIWGAGSKGVTFLNTLKVQGIIKYIVDLNPHKQGKHVAGTGQKIVPPEFLQDHQPDTVIVMNPIYLTEIQHLLAEINVSSKVIVV